jgi:hypothetical protein
MMRTILSMLGLVTVLGVAGPANAQLGLPHHPTVPGGDGDGERLGDLRCVHGG